MSVAPSPSILLPGGSANGAPAEASTSQQKEQDAVIPGVNGIVPTLQYVPALLIHARIPSS